MFRLTAIIVAMLSALSVFAGGGVFDPFSGLTKDTSSIPYLSDKEKAYTSFKLKSIDDGPVVSLLMTTDSLMSKKGALESSKSKVVKITFNCSKSIPMENAKAYLKKLLDGNWKVDDGTIRLNDGRDIIDAFNEWAAKQKKS